MGREIEDAASSQSPKVLPGRTADENTGQITRSMILAHHGACRGARKPGCDVDVSRLTASGCRSRYVIVTFSCWDFCTNWAPGAEELMFTTN